MFCGILAAVFIVSVRLVCDEMEPVFRDKDPIVRQYKYQYYAQKEELKEEYEKSNMPKSGYMLTEDYEALSKGIPRMNLKIDDPKPIKPSDMKYVPQPTYKLVRYNDPPGSPELNVPRKYNFDRQINTQGVVSGDFTKLVYSTVYYYADVNCTACSTFVIPLDMSLTKIERVKKANVARKIDKPIFETDKSISTEGAFRTITPVDFSEDNRYIVAKEKLGWAHEGIWQTNVWVHDFQADRSWKLNEVREAIIQYWQNRTGVNLAEQRWDIYPLGFDRDNQSRILVCGYAYTGDVPAFLGTWAVDVTGEKCELVDLEGKSQNVSMVGFKLTYDSYEPREEVEWEAERNKKIEKVQKKEANKQRKAMKRAHKKVYHEKLKRLKKDYHYKLREYHRSKRRGVTSKGGDETPQVDVNNIQNEQDIDYENFNRNREELIKKQQEELNQKKNNRFKLFKKDKGADKK